MEQQAFSVNVANDTSYENFARRIIYYTHTTNDAIHETQLEGKYLRTLVRAVERFFRANRIRPNEQLARRMALYSKVRFCRLHPEYRRVDDVYDAIEDFVYSVAYGINLSTGDKILRAIKRFTLGRFGRYEIAHPWCVLWTAAVYAALAVGVFYALLPLAHAWDKVVSVLNVIIWSR